jgi:hypothetical protein
MDVVSLDQVAKPVSTRVYGIAQSLCRVSSFIRYKEETSLLEFTYVCSTFHQPSKNHVSINTKDLKL